MENPLYRQVIHKVETLYDLAERVYHTTFPRPTITFKKSGRNAGSAFLSQNRINFNRVLLAHNADEYFNEVIPHEVAHLLCFKLYGRVKPHGNEWQQIMRETFQCEPQTRHSMDTAPLNLKTVAYKCHCDSHQLSRIRHNKVLHNKARYRCRRCNTELTLATEPDL